MDASRPPIVIVGAGLAGAATAYHLRERGVADVVVLERERAAGKQASGRNAAILRTHMDDPALQELADRSAEGLRGLGVVQETGGFLVGVDGATEVLSDDVPWTNDAGAWQAHDGYVDVPTLLARYLEGVTLRTGVEVMGLDGRRANRGGSVLVELEEGTLEASLVVNAAGAWAGDVGGLPIQATKRHLFVSKPDPEVSADHPYVWDVKRGWYARPHEGAVMLCACDETQCTPGDQEVVGKMEQVLRRKLRAAGSPLADVPLAKTWAGNRSFSHDRQPILGVDPRGAWLHHVAALGGHGVTLSYAVGEIVAQGLIEARRRSSSQA